MSSFAISSLVANGIELVGTTRFPLQLAEEDLERSDLVIAVKESEHRAMIVAQFPGWEDRIDYWSVDDIDSLPPHECLRKCEESVSILVQTLERGRVLSLFQQPGWKGRFLSNMNGQSTLVGE